jgi:hypothetical protein
MKLRTMFGLAAIGGLLYAHKRHGGTFTIDSFRQSGRDLWNGARNRVRTYAEREETAEQQAREGTEDLTGTTVVETNLAEPVIAPF